MRYTLILFLFLVAYGHTGAQTQSFFDFTVEDIDNFSDELIGQTLDFIKQFCIDRIMDLNSYNHKKDKRIGF